MKQVFRILLYSVVVLIMLVGIFYAHQAVRLAWNEAARRQAMLQDVPAQTSHTAALKKELDSALIKMNEVYTTIPTRDGLVDVVSAISASAALSGVSAQVPIVQESVVQEAEGSEDIFSDVRIHVVASGEPIALASFLYRIEHLPYLLRIAFWNIDTITQTAVTSFTSTAPVDTTLQVSPPLGSSLEADVAIVTRKK